MTAPRIVLATVFLLPALALAAPAIAPVEPPARGSFDAQVIVRGAELGAIGNCKECHTAADGKPFAGGRPLNTPFGTIHGTNITPDPDTGIGRWRKRVPACVARRPDRKVELYPAFYDHFTKLYRRGRRRALRIMRRGPGAQGRCPTGCFFHSTSAAS